MEMHDPRYIKSLIGVREYTRMAEDEFKKKYSVIFPELTNALFSLVELDNEMKRRGYFSVFDDSDEDSIREATTLYYFNVNDEKEDINILINWIDYDELKIFCIYKTFDMPLLSN